MTCQMCGRDVLLIGGSVGPLRRSRGGLLMGGRGDLVWDAQCIVNLGGPGGPFHICLEWAHA